MKFYVTYAQGSSQRNCYSVVEAADYQEAYRKVWSVCQDRWAFMYPEKGFAQDIFRFGLKRIPLQPQDYEPTAPTAARATEEKATGEAG